MIRLAAVALVATFLGVGCSGGSCDTMYVPSLIVAVVDDATSKPICNATVVVTNEAGTTMTSKTALTVTECAVEVFEPSQGRARPGKYVARATLNGRMQTASASVPAWNACGPEQVTRIDLRL